MNVQSISIHDYSYTLEEERIAKYPLPERSSSRLLVYRNGEINDRLFVNLAEELPEGAVLVRNNSRVIHARLLFQRPTGAQVEVFCLEPSEPSSYELSLQSHQSCVWHCMLGNAKRWRVGSTPLIRELELPELGLVHLSAERIEESLIRFSWDNEAYSFASILDAMGVLPIPPYLNRESEKQDDETYQTVYAKPEGSVAAPTAGLHFTEDIFAELADRGHKVLDLTLHVGAGTFRPVKSDTIGEHEMHRELVTIERSLLTELHSHLGSIVAIGTTSVRSLESLYQLALCIFHNPTISPSELAVEQWSAYNEHSDTAPSTAEALEVLMDYMDRFGLIRLSFPTSILIAPGYRFRLVRGLITNFHQPQSTLLLLIGAFLGKDWRKIYNHALEGDYRFLSYGDSSLLLPE